MFESDLLKYLAVVVLDSEKEYHCFSLTVCLVAEKMWEKALELTFRVFDSNFWPNGTVWLGRGEFFIFQARSLEFLFVRLFFIFLAAKQVRLSWCCVEFWLMWFMWFRDWFDMFSFVAFSLVYEVRPRRM